MASGPITSWQIHGGTMETVKDFYFLGLKNHCRWWQEPWNWNMLAPWKESYDKRGQCTKKQRHHFANKGLSSQSYGFSIVMYGCESWSIKKAEHQRTWYLWSVVLEKTLEGPLDYKEIQPVNPKGNQSWIIIEGLMLKLPILWPPDEKNWLIGKDPDAGKDWRQEMGTTEDEMVG